MFPRTSMLLSSRTNEGWGCKLKTRRVINRARQGLKARITCAAKSGTSVEPNPRETLDFVRQLPAGDLRDTSLDSCWWPGTTKEAMGCWEIWPCSGRPMKRQPRWNGCVSNPPAKWNDRLMARVAFVLAKSDPFNAACHVAEEMEPGPMQNEAIISVLHQWTLSDFTAASDGRNTFPQACCGIVR
jgi:hypothetical protein